MTCCCRLQNLIHATTCAMVTAAVGSGGGTTAACADTRLIGTGAHDEGGWQDGCAEVFCGWMMSARRTVVRGPIG